MNDALDDLDMAMFKRPDLESAREEAAALLESDVEALQAFGSILVEVLDYARLMERGFLAAAEVVPATAMQDRRDAAKAILRRVKQLQRYSDDYARGCKDGLKHARKIVLCQPHPAGTRDDPFGGTTPKRKK